MGWFGLQVGSFGLGLGSFLRANLVFDSASAVFWVRLVIFFFAQRAHFGGWGVEGRGESGFDRFWMDSGRLACGERIVAGAGDERPGTIRGAGWLGPGSSRYRGCFSIHRYHKERPG